MEQKELLDLAEKIVKEVDVNFIDDIEVSIQKTSDDKQRVVIDITHDDY